MIYYTTLMGGYKLKKKVLLVLMTKNLTKNVWHCYMARKYDSTQAHETLLSS